MIKLEETINGFVMTNELLQTRVCFELRKEDKNFILQSTYDGKPFTIAFSTYITGHEYIKLIIKYLMEGYKAQNLKPLKTKRKEDFREAAIQASVIKKYGKMWARRIAAQIKRLQQFVSQEEIKLQKFVFSTVGPKHFNKVMGGIKGCRKFLEENRPDYVQYFDRDIVKYRILIYKILGWQNRGYDYESIFSGESVKHFEYMPDWISKLTAGSNTYVRQSLCKVPGGIHSGFHNFTVFENATVPKVLSNIEMKYFLVSGQFFPEKDIRAATKLYHEYMNRGGDQGKLDFRKNTWYENIRIYTQDCDPNHKGSLTGLMRKAIQWHRQRRYDQIKSQYSDETITKAPPQFILDAITNNKKVKFLDTVQAVRNEGADMGHCVSSYADKAVKGDCFLFHIDYKEEKATVEIVYKYNWINHNPRFKRPALERESDRLTLRQSHGPGNKDNKASKWSTNFFTKLFQEHYGVPAEPVEEDCEVAIPF